MKLMQPDNIYGILELTGSGTSTLIVPKNSGLKRYALHALEQLGLRLKPDEIANGRISVNGLDVLLRRGEDIPKLVMDEANVGHLVLGLTGEDLFEEFGLENPQNPLYVAARYNWEDSQAKYGKPTLCLINRTGRVEDIPHGARIGVKSKFRHTSAQFLGNIGNGAGFEIAVYHGDLEATVARGLTDGCIDIVYSGGTVENYGLKVAQTIKPIDLVFIAVKR